MLSVSIKLSKIKNIIEFGKFVSKYCYCNYYVIDAEKYYLKDKYILEKLEKIKKVVLTLQAKKEEVFK